jgi:integrase
MKTITEYLGGLSVRTAREYQGTHSYFTEWQATKLVFADFPAFLKSRNLSENTIAKHVRQVRTIIRNTDIGIDLDSIPPYSGESKDYPQFTDSDFETLYEAFYGVDYPKFIISGERHRYWHAVLHFVAVTALRRQALLGITLDSVNFEERYVTVESAIDKKHKTRYKPITSELAADLVQLVRYYDKSLIPLEQHGLLFPWGHGSKSWYKVWNAAESKLGKRFHLHDLKRFSGELALRAGATPLELMQHMDHSSLTTTMKHYCRPTTAGLMKKLKVPIPDREGRMTPLFTEPELQSTVLETMRSQLASIGIDIDVVLDRFGLPVLGEGELPKFRRSERGSKLISSKKGEADRPLLPILWDEEGTCVPWQSGGQPCICLGLALQRLVPFRQPHERCTP